MNALVLLTLESRWGGGNYVAAIKSLQKNRKSPIQTTSLRIPLHKIFWRDCRNICKSSTTLEVTASVIFKCRLSFHTQAKKEVILQPRDVPIWNERECNRTLRCVALLISLVVRNGNRRGLANGLYSRRLKRHVADAPMYFKWFRWIIQGGFFDCSALKITKYKEK